MLRKAFLLLLGLILIPCISHAEIITYTHTVKQSFFIRNLYIHSFNHLKCNFFFKFCFFVFYGYFMSTRCLILPSTSTNHLPDGYDSVMKSTIENLSWTIEMIRKILRGRLNMVNPDSSVPGRVWVLSLKVSTSCTTGHKFG